MFMCDYKTLMKTLIGIIALAIVTSAVAVEKPELERKGQKILAKFESLQGKSDKKVPPDLLKKAQGIILLDRTKAGFIFAFQGGSGLSMVKDKSGKWGPVAFMRADEGSLGFQIGGQQSFIVVLLMTTNSTEMLRDASFEFGGEARGTAGERPAPEPRALLIPLKHLWSSTATERACSAAPP